MKGLPFSRLGIHRLSCWIVPLSLGISTAQAASLYWDGSSTSGDADGGAGIWMRGATPPENWDSAATAGIDLPWTSSSVAVFGGVGAAVTISGTVAPSGLSFTVPGYSLNEGIIALIGTPVVDTGSHDVTIGSVVAENDPITKTGSGTLTLNGVNTFTDTLTIAAGTVKAGHNSAFGTTSGGVTVLPGATLDVNAKFLGTEPLTASGAGVDGRGAILNDGGGDHIWEESVALGGPAVFGGSSRWGIGNISFSKFFPMAGHPLTKMGPSTFHLLNITITNPSNIDVKEGSFWVERQSNMGGSAANVITIRNGAGLGLYNSSLGQTPWTAAFEGNTSWLTRANACRWSGPVTLAGATTFNTEDNAVQMTNLGIISGLGSINKTGPGLWTLSGLNTYSGGTTVSGGRLEATQSLGSGPVTIEPGGTLTGSAPILGALTIRGTFDPGVSTQTATIPTGALTLTGNYVCQWGGNQNDKLTVNGDINLAGGTLTLNKTAGSSSPTSFVVATYTGILSGEFATVTGMPAGYVVKYDTTAKQILVARISFATWIAGFPGLADATPDGDPDGDSVSNLAEYVLSGNPGIAEPGILPTFTLDDENLVFRYKRNDISLGNSTQMVMWSQNLTEWGGSTVGASSTPGVLVKSNGNAPDDITVTIPRVPGKMFARLRVTQP